MIMPVGEKMKPNIAEPTVEAAPAYMTKPMIELQWRWCPPMGWVLHYRTLVPSLHASGAWGEPSTWSGWFSAPKAAIETPSTVGLAQVQPPMDGGPIARELP